MRLTYCLHAGSKMGFFTKFLILTSVMELGEIIENEGRVLLTIFVPLALLINPNVGILTPSFEPFGTAPPSTSPTDPPIYTTRTLRNSDQTIHNPDKVYLTVKYDQPS